MNKQISFEDASKELEEIVNALEKGEASLDDSLKMFERGVFLTKQCFQELENAEQKVMLLTKKADGAFTETEFTNGEA